MNSIRSTFFLSSREPVELTRQLCNIESVSGSEGPLADAIAHALAGAEHLTVLRDGDALIARTELGRAQRVIIAGHIDTVPVNGNLPVRDQGPDKAREDEVREDAAPEGAAPEDAASGGAMIWGRGTVDMKAGVAVQLALALELTAPAVDITWVWYDHEEVADELNGLGRVMRHHPNLFDADFAILGEPTSGNVEGGCNGTLRAVVRVSGVQAHSARSWMGRNAIHRAATLLQRLEEFEASAIEVDGLTYREGLNAVRIGGGVAGNVVPDLCEIEVNFRFAPSRSIDEAQQFVRDFFFDADEVQFVDVAAGARPGLQHPFVREFVEAMGVKVHPKLGWTDVSRFSALGIPAVNFGPGDPLLAHADDERVAVAEIERVAEALRAWLST